MKGNDLKRKRAQLGLTIGRVANDMYLTPQTICNLERGAITKKSSLKYYELYLKRYEGIKTYNAIYREEHQK